MTTTAREIHLKSRPKGMPERANFQIVETPMSALRKEELRVRNLWMSVDPYMRGRMNAGSSYIDPFRLDAPLEGAAIGIVEESECPAFAPGDLVSHFKGWRTHAIVDAATTVRIDADQIAPQTYLGPLGVPGFTAYVGLTRIGQVRVGDSVFISAASGAVGSIACQIAKIKGARVAGSAGSDAKLAWLRDELGIDAAIGYRADDFAQTLAEACPDGIDLYFDNVGGGQLEAALVVANDHARFTLCGMIARHNDVEPAPGPSNIFLAVTKRLNLRGFIITDHDDLAAEFQNLMRAWIAQGQIKWRETIFEGLERAPDALLGLFHGANVGKMLVRLEA